MEQAARELVVPISVAKRLLVVVGNDFGRLRLSVGNRLRDPLRDAPVEGAARGSVAYATSCVSACLKANSRRPENDDPTCSLTIARLPRPAMTSSSTPTAEGQNIRPITEQRRNASRSAACKRSMRAAITPWIESGNVMEAGTAKSEGSSARRHERFPFEQLAVDQRSEQLLDEERVALGRAEDGSGHVLRDRVRVEERLEQALRFANAQRRERQR